MRPLAFPVTMINTLTITALWKETNIYLFSRVPLIFISWAIKLSRSAARSHFSLLITARSKWHNPSAIIHSCVFANANSLHGRSVSEAWSSVWPTESKSQTLKSPAVIVATAVWPFEAQASTFWLCFQNWWCQGSHCSDFRPWKINASTTNNISLDYWLHFHYI